MNRILLMVLRNLFKAPFLYMKLCKYAKKPDSYPEETMYAHIRGMLNLGIESGNIKFHVSGKENFPEKNGFIMYGNHQGLFDALAIVSACEMPIGTIFKHEIKNVPFIKQVAACTRSFPMDRSDDRQSLKVIQNVTAEVLKGRNYIIFPEGTRSRKGNEMMEFHGGSFRAAIKAKCPVIPVAFIDTYKVFDIKGTAPVECQLHLLPAIMPEEYEGMKATELAEMVKQRIADAIALHTAGK
ncbi:MAG: 1-acyl-sn-glycerol-3-phosphate acyltransferase [Firmicutes bacterium]|nr:1-acyl-sn-glycerol-3-phosphate acyltransferase [Bacillota bacterium]